MKSKLLTTFTLVVATIFTGVLFADDFALSFNGANAYVNAGTPAGMSRMTAITLEAWIKPSGFSANYWENVIMEKSGFGSHGFTLRCGGNGILDASLSEGGWTNNWVTSPQWSLTADGTWYHVAATYDGTWLRLYINGIEVDSAEYLNLEIACENSLRIGMAENWGRYFQGVIDECMVWNYARDVNQIQTDMTSGAVQGSMGLLLYFKMNEGIGVVLNDSSGNANMGTLVNNPLWVEGKTFEETLPVVLSSFTAIQTSTSQARLQWITQSELNLIGYIIQRSADSSYSNSMIVSPFIPATNTPFQQTYTFTDIEASFGTWYYWLVSEGIDGTQASFGPVVLNLSDPSSTPALPERSILKDAYPNPFRTDTKIEVEVKGGEKGKVSIYNSIGQLIHSYSVNAGSHTLLWDGKDASGASCPNGMYLYSLDTNTQRTTKKMILLR